LLDSLLQEKIMLRCLKLNCSYSRLLQVNQRARLAKQIRTIVLGIETSCDDTGAAVIDQSGRLLGECISSQLSTRYGGVIPTFAMIFHRDKIEGVVNEALKQAGVGIEDISCVAVTNRPGLKGPLLVGTDYAKYLCSKYNKPMIPIHHMAAHALTVRMEEDVKFPFMILLISGGHCILGIAKDIDDFVLLGASKDDSPGETLDKVARRLRLHSLPNMRDISGGRTLEIFAESGDRLQFPVGVPLREYKDCNFSFSGLKGHMDYILRRINKTSDFPSHEVLPQARDICASVQYSLTKHLCERVQRGIEFVEYDEMMEVGGTLVVSGGVASNQYIRRSLSHVCQELGWRAVYPKPKLCTDNGIMIGWAGYEFWKQQRGIVQPKDVFDVEVSPKCPLGENISDRVTATNLKCKWIKLDSSW